MYKLSELAEKQRQYEEFRKRYEELRQTLPRVKALTELSIETGWSYPQLWRIVNRKTKTDKVTEKRSYPKG